MQQPNDRIARLLKEHRDIVGSIWTAIEEISRLEPFGRPARQYLYRALDDLQKVRDDLAEALDRIDPDWDEATNAEAEADASLLEATKPTITTATHRIVKGDRVIWEGDAEEFAALLGGMDWEESEFPHPARYRRLVSRYYPTTAAQP